MWPPTAETKDVMLKKLRELLARRGQKASPPETPVRPAVHHGPQVVHRPIPLSDLDPDAVKILERLTRFDHKAYLVGGCVRDLLLEGRPKDFDIATSATPRQVRRVFRNCRIIGRRFRLAHIYFQDGKIIEVATFRATSDEAAPAGNADAEDLLIREDNLFGTPESDALRRDFTVNALFYDLQNGNVIDHAQGLDDLRHRLIRTIGDPNIRFPEDPIRILRAIKFAARLDFTIEPGTLAALNKARHEIPKAAPPRVLEEISRFGRERAARRSFELLRETRVFEVILPELADAYRGDDAWRFLLPILDGMDRRRRNDQNVETGEVFAALLIPTLMEHLGWSPKGKAQQPRKLDLRELVDRRLRPLAVRLRVSRHDQELCRQIIGILFRMVPLASVRPATRRGLVRRVSFHNALWMLEALAGELGGDFADASKVWKSATPARTAGQSAQPTRTGEDEEDDAEFADEVESDEENRAPRRRRSRRRGGRGRAVAGTPGAKGGGNAGAGAGQRKAVPAVDGPRPPAARRPQSAPERSPVPKRPQVPQKWDDDYFFAALPNAPKMTGEDARGDRYGAGNVLGSAVTTTAIESEDETPETPRGNRGGASQAQPGEDERPGRKRRRRRRRPRSDRGDEGPNSEPSGDDNDGDPSAEE